MVRRIDASAAVAQLQLTARPTGQKWSAAFVSRSNISTGPAAAAWSVQQVGSSRWLLGAADGSLGAADGSGRLCQPARRATRTDPPTRD